MKVLVIGGYARSLINFRGPLLKAMVSRGHDVVAAAPKIDALIADDLEAIGVRFASVQIQRTGTNPVRDAVGLLDLIGLMRRERPDLFLGYTAKPVIYGTIAARITNVPHRAAMITGLGYAFGHESGGVGRITRLLYRASVSTCHSVVFQNPDDQAHFVDHGYVPRDRTFVTNGSGVDLEHFTQAPLPEGRPTFLLIARLLAAKGIREFAAAARVLRREFPEARFVLVGPFDSNPTAIGPTEVQAWSDEGVLEYVGPADDVRPWIRGTHVYVLPSSYREGTPRTVLEAMAMGRPIVTTDAPGCRETVEEGRNGYLVPVCDPDALAAAMRHFLTEPDKIARMGAESHAIARVRYDVHKVNATVLNHFGL